MATESFVLGHTVSHCHSLHQTLKPFLLLFRAWIYSKPACSSLLNTVSLQLQTCSTAVRNHRRHSGPSVAARQSVRAAAKGEPKHLAPPRNSLRWEKFLKATSGLFHHLPVNRHLKGYVQVNQNFKCYCPDYRAGYKGNSWIIISRRDLKFPFPFYCQSKYIYIYFFFLWRTKENIQNCNLCTLAL